MTEAEPGAGASDDRRSGGAGNEGGLQEPQRAGVLPAGRAEVSPPPFLAPVGGGRRGKAELGLCRGGRVGEGLPGEALGTCSCHSQGMGPGVQRVTG